LQAQDITVIIAQTIIDSIPLFVRIYPPNVPRQNIPLFYTHDNKILRESETARKHQFFGPLDDPALGLLSLSVLLDLLLFLEVGLLCLDVPTSGSMVSLSFLDLPIAPF
jgi:hypothetical protein